MPNIPSYFVEHHSDRKEPGRALHTERRKGDKNERAQNFDSKPEARRMLCGCLQIARHVDKWHGHEEPCKQNSLKVHGTQPRQRVSHRQITTTIVAAAATRPGCSNLLFSRSFWTRPAGPLHLNVLFTRFQALLGNSRRPEVQKSRITGRRFSPMVSSMGLSSETWVP